MWYQRFSLVGKSVLLTGAAGGIGSALLRGFLEAGAHVHAVTRRDDTDWKGLDTRFPNSFHPKRCDLSSQVEVLQLVAAVEQDERGIDVLINNASDCPHLDENFYQIDVFRKTCAVTLEAAYLLCGELAPRMASRGQGCIINVISMNAVMAWPGNPAYITAKAGLRMLTKALARDFGEAGVRANNLCPGYVHTRLTEFSFVEPQLHEQRRQHTMLGRWGNVEDMVGPCLFLASDAASYVTGVDLFVDGGWTAKGM